MCGFAGALDPEAREEELEPRIRAMTDTLVHRGPDDDGVWTEPGVGLALGSRRLAIVDLSSEGHMPMVSERSVLVFNGEIYNFRELREELEGAGVRFRGSSDTEVAQAAMDRWGVESALRRFNGMFAIACWDRQERRLTLARDRIGEKPLYHGTCGTAFVFGSELKALRRHPAFDDAIDHQALAGFLRHKYVPGPASIYAGISKLPPGTLLEVGPDGRAGAPRAYWSLAAVIGEQERDLTQHEAIESFDALLRDAVARRMVSDVPLGAFLSGGIDSTTVVALMQAQSDRPVKTFTIGSAEADYDEASDAAGVAAHLGTDHTALRVTPDDAMAVIPRLGSIYDEPFADSSQIPTLLVAELARRDVTVALSGDGGDEVFGGYNRYVWGPRVAGRLRRMPAPLRRIAARGITSVPPPTWDRMLRPTGQRMAGDKMHKLAGALPSSGADDLYRRLTSHWTDPSALIAAAVDPALPALPPPPPGLGIAERMMFWDTMTYLPDDILVKLDRATMAVSLEGRVPLLDHRIVELSWRLPLDLRIRDGVGKWLLRQVLAPLVPPALTERPKMGFGVPIGAWLRGPLRAWAEDLLSTDALQPHLRPEPIREVWQQHLSGRWNRQYQLWDVLMFQSWLRESQP